MVLFMAAVIFNLSIDPPDREANGVAEDLSQNDIESIVELVAEQWLCIEDFLPEHDESDETGFAKKTTDYRCTRSFVSFMVPDSQAIEVVNYPFADQFTAQLEPVPRVPPPWS
jgi:hypothetical protein